MYGSFMFYVVVFVAKESSAVLQRRGARDIID